MASFKCLSTDTISSENKKYSSDKVLSEKTKYSSLKYFLGILIQLWRTKLSCASRRRVENILDILDFGSEVQRGHLEAFMLQPPCGGEERAAILLCHSIQPLDTAVI
jgi:hypothetical protein